MASLLTISAANVFAPADFRGLPRGADMAEAQRWGVEIEALLQSISAAGGAVVFGDLASANLNVNYPSGQMSWIMNDPTVANNGIYAKIGGSGTGYWSRVGDLPYSYISAANAGSGTGEHIQATTTMPIPSADGGALISLPILSTNVFSPVTVSFNGGTALHVLTSSGLEVPDGGLVAGMTVAGYKVGGEFRLLSDISSASIQLAAEEAAAEAQQALEETLEAISSVLLHSFKNAAAAAAYNPDVSPDFLIIETPERQYYAKSASMPVSGPKIQIANGTWYGLTSNPVTTLLSYVVNNGTADASGSITIAGSGENLVVPSGNYRLDSNVLRPVSSPVTLGGSVAFSGTGKLSARIIKPEIPVLHNFKRSNLGLWRNVIAQARFFGGQVYVGCIGDSTNQGWGAGKSWPVRTAQAMKAYGLNARWSNFFGTKMYGTLPELTAYDSRITFPDSAGWSIDATYLNFGGRALTSSGGGRLRFTPSALDAGDNPTAFEVWYWDKSDHGNVVVTLSGGSTATGTTTQDGRLNKVLVGGATGTTYADITASAGLIYVQGVVSFVPGTGTVHFLNFGFNGAKPSDFAVNAYPWSPLNAFDDVPTNLVMINLGINDWLSNTNRDTFRTQYTQIIQAAQAAGREIILVAPIPSNPDITTITTAKQEEIRSIIYGLSYDFDLPLIDLWARFGSFSNGYSDGLYQDVIHPNDTGYAEIGAFIAHTLMSV